MTCGRISLRTYPSLYASFALYSNWFCIGNVKSLQQSKNMKIRIKSKIFRKKIKLKYNEKMLLPLYLFLNGCFLYASFTSHELIFFNTFFVMCQSVTLFLFLFDAFAFNYLSYFCDYCILSLFYFSLSSYLLLRFAAINSRIYPRASRSLPHSPLSIFAIMH